MIKIENGEVENGGVVVPPLGTNSSLYFIVIVIL